jgi:hypothetical protein
MRSTRIFFARAGYLFEAFVDLLIEVLVHTAIVVLLDEWTIATSWIECCAKRSPLHLSPEAVCESASLSLIMKARATVLFISSCSTLQAYHMETLQGNTCSYVKCQPERMPL